MLEKYLNKVSSLFFDKGKYIIMNVYIANSNMYFVKRNIEAYILSAKMLAVNHRLFCSEIIFK